MTLPTSLSDVAAILDYLDSEGPIFFDNRPQPLLWTGSQAACVRITVCGILNCLKHCVFFNSRVESGYNDVGLYNTLLIASDILQHQLIPHF